MSTEDNHPAQSPDTARPVYPVTFFDKARDDPNSPMTDFRAIVVPADAEDDKKAAPKDESAPAPASPKTTPSPENPVQTAAKAAPKVSGPPKTANTSSSPKTTGE